MTQTCMALNILATADYYEDDMICSAIRYHQACEYNYRRPGERPYVVPFIDRSAEDRMGKIAKIKNVMCRAHQHKSCEGVAKFTRCKLLKHGDVLSS